MSTITLLNIVDKRTTILPGTLQDSFGSWITYLRLILPNRRVKIKRVRGTQKNYDRSRLLWRTANSRNVSFDSWNSGQFTLSTQLMIPNYPVILFHRRSTTVPLETYPINYRSQLIIIITRFILVIIETQAEAAEENEDFPFNNSSGKKLIVDQLFCMCHNTRARNGRVCQHTE